MEEITNPFPEKRSEKPESIASPSEVNDKNSQKEKNLPPTPKTIPPSKTKTYLLITISAAIITSLFLAGVIWVVDYFLRKGGEGVFF